MLVCRRGLELQVLRRKTSEKRRGNYIKEGTGIRNRAGADHWNVRRKVYRESLGGDRRPDQRKEKGRGEKNAKPKWRSRRNRETTESLFKMIKLKGTDTEEGGGAGRNKTASAHERSQGYLDLFEDRRSSHIRVHGGIGASQQNKAASPKSLKKKKYSISKGGRGC